MIQHNYINPSKRVDTSNVESDASGYVDKNGWTVRPPISDRECIYKCLYNCEYMTGLDKHQVKRLMKDFEVERTEEELRSEYPPL
jgi:hypothetical protein